MFVVKGKIREYSLYGNQNILRKGSPHFLPNTEVVLCHFYNSQYRLHNKLWVRGIHKSGLLKTKPTYFKFITDLKLEAVKNPSMKTLDFIKSNKILTTGTENPKYSFIEVKELLEYFNKIQEPEILIGEIQDELFLNSKTYITKIQNLIRTENFKYIFDNELNFPLEIKKRQNQKNEKINKKQFLVNYKSQFCSRIGKTILETDLETIFPSENRIIIGLAEIGISKNYEFKITKIEINRTQ